MVKKRFILGISLLIFLFFGLSTTAYAQKTLKVGIISTKNSYPQKKQTAYDLALTKEIGRAHV